MLRHQLGDLRLGRPDDGSAFLVLADEELRILAAALPKMATLKGSASRKQVAALNIELPVPRPNSCLPSARTSGTRLSGGRLMVRSKLLPEGS
jgi:hypothetical protein